MIGKLQGVVDFIGDGFVIIMVAGVGYKVYCPESLSPNSTVSLWIETVVREDSIRLFGFTSSAQNELFNQLTTVSGVGPKVALALLNTLKTEILLSAIASGDTKTITETPGVGKKVAEKIILELKGKVGGIRFEMTNENNVLSDLLSAMESLGYRRINIIEMAQHLVDSNPALGVAQLVPMALKQITTKH